MKTTDFKQMQRRIMMHVYRTFAIRLATHPLTLHVGLLVGAAYAVGYFVHVAAVMRNMANVPVGELGGFLARAVTNTEGITLLVLGVMIFAALSLPIQLPQYRRSLREMAT